MKRLEIKKLITCSLIMTTITSTISITAKAENLSGVYQQAYDSAMNVVDIGKKYNVIPRHSDNNTSIESNTIETVYRAVKDGDMQKAINHARECINKLPQDQWKAKNTFSSILDGYQQPSYEHIVDAILKLDKLTQKYENEFKYSSDWNESKKNQFCDAINKLQSFIEIARILNNGVDPAYGNAYSSALDKPQQRVINMINSVINEAKKTQNINDINFAEKVIKVFKENISSNSNIKDYVNQLQSYVDSLKTLSELKSKLESMDKEIASLKEDKNDFKNAIKEINNKLENLQNQGGSSTTIIQVPEALKNAVKNNTNAIKDLQKKVDELSDKLGQPTFNPDRNKQLLDSANTALDNFKTNTNNETLNEVRSNVSTFLNYYFTENKNDHKTIYQKMYTIAKPLADKAITDENLDDLNLIRDFLSVAINSSSYDACHNPNYDIKALRDNVINKINEIEMHQGYETRLNKISESIKNIQSVSDARNVCYELSYFKDKNLNESNINLLNTVTNEFFNYLEEYKNNANTLEKQNNLLSLSSSFLNSLKEGNACIQKTEEIVIKCYTKGINELKTQPRMNTEMVSIYVSSVTSHYFNLKNNANIENTCLKLIDELGTIIINQINQDNFQNKDVLTASIINNLKEESKESNRYKLGEKLQNTFINNKLNHISQLIKNIKNNSDAYAICDKFRDFHFIGLRLSADNINNLNKVTNQFVNYLNTKANNVKNGSEASEFLSLTNSFLIVLFDNSPSIKNTETVVIDYFTNGINKLKTQSTMDPNMIDCYVDTIFWSRVYNNNIENSCLNLLEELGDTIIDQISQGNSNNEPIINNIIRDLKSNQTSTSKRYLLAEKLQQKLNEVKNNAQKTKTSTKATPKKVQVENQKVQNDKSKVNTKNSIQNSKAN